MRKPKVIDLFAGAGFFSLAFTQLKFEIIRAVESDRVAAHVYAHNLGNHIEIADVSQASPHGKCDVLIAGPPCQGFSTLNFSSSKDPRNKLCLQVARWAEATSPKVVVVENVAAFLDSRYWSLLAAKLERLGYHVAAMVADAVNFGVPQTRRRSFTFASKKPLNLVMQQHLGKPRTVRDAFDGLSLNPNDRNGHSSPKPSRIALQRMMAIPPGGDKRDLMKLHPSLAAPSWWKIAGQVTDVWGRMAWDEPCNTLRTCFQNPSKGRYIHPNQNRVISLREAARLQTIPDEWEFLGLPTHTARQIGNGVPLALGRAIAQVTLRQL